MKLCRHLGHRRLARYFIITNVAELDSVFWLATDMPKEFTSVEASQWRLTLAINWVLSRATCSDRWFLLT
jgi:hypothetical protein